MCGKYIMNKNNEPQICEDPREWGAWYEKADRRIALTRLQSGVEISTVFLAMDYCFGDNGPPLIYETMVFGGTDTQSCRRYSTWERALEGHSEEVTRQIKGEQTNERNG